MSKPRHIFGRGRRKSPAGMNRTEQRRGEHLLLLQAAGEIAWFEFEPAKLRLAHNTFYTPDFLIMLPDGELVFEDVKGAKGDKPYIEEDANVKIKAAAAKFPVRFRLAWPAPGNDGWREKEIKPG